MQKDIMYRDWNAAKGGVYVRVDQNVEPNPHLAHLDDRDILTQSNQKLTLVNPAYMTKLVHKMGPEKYSLRAHLTSSKPLNENNMADPWEKTALMLLEEGEAEVTELVSIKDSPFMRVIIPLWVDKPCLKCHEKQGYLEGDLRGGISVSVPMENLIAETRNHIFEQILWGVTVLVAGLIGIFFFYYQFKRQLRKYSLSEKKADRLQDQWNSTFDEIGDIISIQNDKYEIQKMNKAGCDYLNLTLGDVVGKRCYNLFLKADHPCPGCYASLDNIDDFPPYLNEVRVDDDHTFLISVAPIRGDDGSVSGNVHMAKDITKTRDLEKRLQHSQKMEAIGTLAGGIAHDFNNILTAIIGFSQLIKDMLPETNHRAKANLEHVLKAGNQATGLVHQILTFSRQHNQEEENPVEVQAIAQEVIALLQSSIPKSIVIKQNLDQECRPVMANPSKIHQIIMNLCTNSYQAMCESGGVLTINLGEITIGPDDEVYSMLMLKPGEYLLLEVQDTGHGITSDMIDKIFDPYFTTKPKGEGTGLGLATVHGIVEALGGKAIVQSMPGAGTTFRIVLPLVINETGYEEDSVEEVIPAGNEKILVIDDQEEIVELLRQMLGNLGYKITTRSCSIEACELFKVKADDFDLIITDFDMPNMTGIEIARKFYAIRPGIPIILCTGFGDRISMEKARSVGIQEFVNKPILKKDIAQKIRKVLDEGKG